MKVLIDNGHGDPPLTGGKLSPDGRLREYTYCRDIAQRVSRGLSLRGIDAILLTPEKSDIPLKERVRRANAWSNKLGSKNVVVVSIHNNAGPESDQLIVEKGQYGTWKSARGFMAIVSSNASQASKKLAEILYRRACEMGLKGNRATPPEGYWVQSLAMTRDTKCPAVLTENLFQDNREDVEFLLSDEGRQTIARLHVESLIEYIKAMQG